MIARYAIVDEIGGTVGDIESQPFLEAIRQMKLQLDLNKISYSLMHLTLCSLYMLSAG